MFSFLQSQRTAVCGWLVGESEGGGRDSGGCRLDGGLLAAGRSCVSRYSSHIDNGPVGASLMATISMDDHHWGL